MASQTTAQPTNTAQTDANADGSEGDQVVSMLNAQVANMAAPVKAAAATTPCNQSYTDKNGKQKGTNIAITTATDQHIDIFVPENPAKRVTVHKTEGVAVQESDDDHLDPAD